jgi:hypothetical protein
MQTRGRVVAKYKCPKCGEITELVDHSTALKAGDNGFHKSVVKAMKCCGFAPLILPKPIEGEN